MSNQNYPRSQASLYSTANYLINLLAANLAAFTAFKAKYTALFVTSLRAALTAAQAMPDNDNRNSDGNIARDAAEEAADN